MNTVYTNNINGTATSIQNKTQHVQDINHPAYQEIVRNVGAFDISVVVEEDKQTLAVFKNVPGMIAFKTTLKQSGEVIGEGRGTAVINRNNKFIERTVRLAFNNSILGAVFHSTKILDILRPEINTVSVEEDLEGRDKPVSFADEELRYASDKQKNFLRKLIDSNCDVDSKAKYISQLNQPLLSSFQCSQLISGLLHK